MKVTRTSGVSTMVYFQMLALIASRFFGAVAFTFQLESLRQGKQGNQGIIVEDGTQALPATHGHGSVNVSKSQAADFFLDGKLDFENPVDQDEMAKHYVRLFNRYKSELHSLYSRSNEFNEKLKKDDACHGRIATIEQSMLYIMIREYQPKQMVEIGALCGTSTFVMLAALEKNGHGKLITFDLSDKVTHFIKATAAWTFHMGDALESIRRNPSVISSLELIFIDALHTNAFAADYIKVLLNKVRRPTPTFVHDVYNPFLIEEFKSCAGDHGMTLSSMPGEMACMRRVVEEHGNNMLYSPAQASGEGNELLTWLGRTGRSSGAVTFSPYAAPNLATPMIKAFDKSGMSSGQINNPSMFFLLLPR